MVQSKLGDESSDSTRIAREPLPPGPLDPCLPYGERSAATNTEGKEAEMALAQVSTVDNGSAQPVDRLTQACELVAGIDLSTADAALLTRVTAELRRLENRCAGVAVDIARRAKELGDDPDATLLGNGKVSGRTSRKESKRAGVTERMTRVGDKLREGEVSGEHLDAIANAAADLSDEEAELFAQLDGELAEAASQQPVDTFRRKLRDAVDKCRSDHGEERLRKQRARSELKMWTDADGMGHAHITADPERFATFQTAIERETARLAAAAKAGGESVNLGPGLQFEALMQLIEGTPGSPARPEISVLIDHETLVDGPHEHTVCETTKGVPLPLTVIERYTCDGVIRVVTLGDTGLPIDVGRKHRTATAAQWAALKAIYLTCAWFGCDRSVDWCQAHHIHEWEHGGPTDLINLVPLCSRHHHMVHEGDWRLVMQADRTLEIHRPAGDAPNDPAGQPNRPGQPMGPHHRPRPNPASLWATTVPDRLPRHHAA